VTIEIRTDLPDERFFIGATMTTDPVDRGPLTIESTRDHSGILLLKFKEASDRTAVEKLRDTLLLADVDIADEAVVEGEYHVQQLVGLAVVDTSGKTFGELADVLNLPGQDVLAINTPTGEVLIPFVKEFVPTVDLENRKITIAPPEGLLGVADE